ncbi:MAG TPA: zf-HC2 domain-containing protein [Actinomycetota bacterium]
MDHEQAERLISERLDGERLSSRQTVALERHLETCAECRAFERGAWRLRESARFEVAPAVPDLVEPIMAAVEGESRQTRPGLRVARPMRLPRRLMFPRLAPVIAAALAGVLVGSLVVGGPWSDDEVPPGRAALAAEHVSRGVAAAAGGFTAYHAEFTITERNLSDEVRERELSMRVWFRAPERFRLDVEDRTDYPSPATRTDLRLIVDRDRWYTSGPAPCPSATCPQRETSVRNRVPFSSAAPAPTDLVLPLAALAEPDVMDVVGSGTVLGHEAVVVELPFERSASLFPFLSLGGEWRPFFPQDRVRIWLDAESWFPLRWRAFPAAGRERAAWALRFGLPREAAGTSVFEVEARSVELAPPPAGVFEIPSTRRTEDQGARPVRLEEVRAVTGFEPVAPAEVDGLELYRVVIPETPEAGAAIVTYADGLSFLKLGETRSWAAAAPFGAVGLQAEEVMLPGGGVAYFEPATPRLGRRLSIHAAGTDLYLESNLPRDRLLEVAASLPVVGLPMPDEWRVREIGGVVVERVTLEEAAAAILFGLALPESLPAGVAFTSVELVRAGGSVGVTVYYRDVAASAGGALRLHQEAATSLPPASAAEQSKLEVDGAPARWTASRSRLEWVRDGVYASLDGVGFELEELLAVAESMDGVR